MTTYTLEMLLRNSLDTVERWHSYGLVARADLDAYLTAWNATPGRLNRAVYRDGAIRLEVAW